MNSIPSTTGVYGVVFHLSRKTEIICDRKGSAHSFLPGWYFYVGSACGAGGLRGRLARHQRKIADGKRMHWHVDYFRERAILCEIWFCETEDARLEHHWAQTIADLVGTTVPVPKFGASDCDAQCPAHFFYLPDRPSTALFRSKLGSNGRLTTVSVEFIGESRSKKSAARGLQSEYFLGRRFLELRRRAISQSSIEPCQWTSLAKHQPARQLAEEVAKQANVAFARLKRAIEFTTAVETIIENCGEPAWSVLFDSNRPQGRKAIMSLSRTSDVRQVYRVNGVIVGRFPSLAPHGDDTVYDTVKFGEVPSRLYRARGSLEKLLHLLKTDDEDVVSEAKRLSRLCGQSAHRLEDCLKKRISPAPAVPRNLGKPAIMSILRSKAVRGRTIGIARQALRLTIKNLWDFEEMMRRGLAPTPNEGQYTQRELARIQEISGLIEREGAIAGETRNHVGGNHRSMT